MREKIITPMSTNFIRLKSPMTSMSANAQDHKGRESTKTRGEWWL